MRIVTLHDAAADLPAIAERRGTWADWFDAYVIDTLRETGHVVDPLRLDHELDGVLAALRDRRPDLVFNLALSALNDRGNDVYSAVLLELAGIPYTGAGPRGLFLAGDKALSKHVLRAHGIDVPAFQVIHRADDAVWPGFGPLLVKALNRGGSEGLTPASLVRDRRALRRAVARIVDDYACPAICEEYIEGRELSVGIVGNARPRVLPPGEWDFGAGPPFVTHRVKWDIPWADGVGVRFEPARLTPALGRRVTTVCRRTFQLLELRDYASIDLRITPEGRIVVLEANANPGLFPGSLRFKPLPFPRLLNGIVRAARARGAPRPLGV